MKITNNDLIDKKYGNAFNYYITPENPPKMNDYVTEVQTTGNPDMVSTYAWDLGYVHFICVNSNEEQMYDGVTVNNFIAKQCAWLDAHLTQVKQRETQPRWIIVFMHLSPFTCVRTPRVQPFVPVFEKHKVDLVLCGHNHTTTRSKCLYTGFNGVPYKDMTSNTGITYNRYVNLVKNSDDTVSNLIDADKEYKDYEHPENGVINREEDILNGTYYVMNGATGFKTTGKETGIEFTIDTLIGSEHSNKDVQSGVWPWWYAWWGGVMTQPTYMTIEITGDQIKLVAKQVPNVLTKESDTGVVIVNDFDYDNPDKFKPNSDYDTEGLIINYQEERHVKE